MNNDKRREFVGKVIEATKANKLTWRNTENGGYTTRLVAGSVLLSNVISDQRDGDFCNFTVTDTAGGVAMTTTIGTQLHKLIADGPGDSVVASMLDELNALLDGED